MKDKIMNKNLKRAGILALAFAGVTAVGAVSTQYVVKACLESSGLEDVSVGMTHFAKVTDGNERGSYLLENAFTAKSAEKDGRVKTVKAFFYSNPGMGGYALGPHAAFN